MSASSTKKPQWLMKIVLPNGQETVERLTSEPDLDTLRKAIGGGYIQMLPLFDCVEISDRVYDKNVVAYVDEDGRSRGLPFNRKATIAWLQCMDDEHSFVYVPYVLGPMVAIVKVRAP